MFAEPFREQKGDTILSVRSITSSTPLAAVQLLVTAKRRLNFAARMEDSLEAREGKEEGCRSGGG